MNPIQIAFLTFTGFGISCPVFAQECGGPKDEFGITKLENAIAFSSPRLNVDADGAPNAYRVDGNGLSYTCDGVVAIENGKRITPKLDPVNWQTKCNAAWNKAQLTNDYSNVSIFGFAKDKNNRPLIQGAGDPLPGIAYITTTSVEIPAAPEGTQRRQIDASKIPYIVLPYNAVNRYRIGPADIAVVYRPSTGNLAFAIYGDRGAPGEGSLKLHFDLGNNPILLRNGVERAKRRIEDRVITIVFPGKSTERVLDANTWVSQIQTIGEAQFRAFGGMERLKLCSTKF